MKPASIHDLKKDLSFLEKEDLIAVCLRLAKYKKENKELLTYLLRESENEGYYVDKLKEEVSGQFLSMNTSTNYLTKKSLRKIVRYMDRFLRYSGNKESEIEVRIHFCKQMKDSDISIYQSVLITNIYMRQMEKVKKNLSLIHEDLRYDYVHLIDDLAL